MINGIRFYYVVWSFEPPENIETTIEAAHSKRYLVDQIKKGLIHDGRTKYYKIQEIETPLIELDYYSRLMAGDKITAKEREAHRQQDAYVLELIKSCAARYTDNKGVTVER